MDSNAGRTVLQLQIEMAARERYVEVPTSTSCVPTRWERKRKPQPLHVLLHLERMQTKKVWGRGPCCPYPRSGSEEKPRNCCSSVDAVARTLLLWHGIIRPWQPASHAAGGATRNGPASVGRRNSKSNEGHRPGSAVQFDARFVQLGQPFILARCYDHACHHTAID